MEDWADRFRKIVSSKDYIGLIYRNICEFNGKNLTVYDFPIRIEISDNSIVFYLMDSLAGILDENGLQIFEEVAKDEIEGWCIALSSPGFKRYSIKRR